MLRSFEAKHELGSIQTELKSLVYYNCLLFIDIFPFNNF